jgi:hypothetical protein
MLTSITCAVYNYDGTEIIASYNDEEIYLFKTDAEDGSQFHKKFQGHQNSATGKLSSLLTRTDGLHKLGIGLVLVLVAALMPEKLRHSHECGHHCVEILIGTYAL